VAAGFVLNIVTVPVLLLATVTWGDAFFDFQNLPPEFGSVNASSLYNVTQL
jgi:hypothetical protein